MMQIGVVAPQGWMAEFAGWAPAAAWARIVRVAQECDTLGIESLWVFDHFLTNGNRDDSAPTFESFATVTALAALTERIRIGHTVICAGYRNPALMAKAIATADVLSGGRIELGIGAGWNENEWRRYGFGFPATRTRLEILRESLVIIGALLSDGKATYEGTHVQALEAIISPRGLQEPRIPIVVGGNGPNVTWRLAARYADEVNLDGMTPAQVAEALPVIASRCDEVGRKPESLRVSVNLWSDVSMVSGGSRVTLIRQMADLGVTRLTFHLLDVVTDDRTLVRLTEDAAAAGIELTASD
jgi:F420-dependent oxidoreductase-like protein